MAKRIGGLRRKTRTLFRKNVREKGKISLGRYFAKFKAGEKVVLLSEPAVQTGMYHPRWHGRVGVVLEQIGACYNVEVKDGNKAKKVTIHPVHLKAAV